MENTKPSPTHINIGITNKEENEPNQNNKRSDNNISPIEGKDNETNCLIDPIGDIQTTESRVTNNVISRAYIVILYAKMKILFLCNNIGNNITF